MLVHELLKEQPEELSRVNVMPDAKEGAQAARR